MFFNFHKKKFVNMIYWFMINEVSTNNCKLFYFIFNPSGIGIDNQLRNYVWRYMKTWCDIGVVVNGDFLHYLYQLPSIQLFLRDHLILLFLIESLSRILAELIPSRSDSIQYGWPEYYDQNIMNFGPNWKFLQVRPNGCNQKLRGPNYAMQTW